MRFLTAQNHTVLKTRQTYLFLAVASVIALSGCSTKKNTAGRRFYHSFTTKYNVYFNANEAYKKGEKKVEDQYQPDYSHIIDMFAISNKSTQGLAKTDMNIVETKCQKAIKEHSIKKKPKKDVNRTRDPKYMEFYNKEEFNKKMYDVWLLLGKAKFYSNDYLAASATFTYIIKHFPENKELVAEASVWKARALREMDWTYEAEGTLENLSDEAFTPSINGFYSATYADLKIKNGELAEALPYLYTAIENEKKKKIKTRYRFVAAQICQALGQNAKAYELYGQVIKSSPNYQMAFNSRIRQTEVYEGQDSEALIKSLLKMAKKNNNKDYLDQIYYAIGNVYLRKQDTTNAIANYKLSIEKSTRNGLDKAQSLITLGTLYYNKAEYIKAEPCFTDAVVLIDQNYPNYTRINNLAQVLGELAQQYNIVHLQDSLIALSKMSKVEQLAAAQRQIELLKEEERKEQERIRQEELRNKQLDTEIENMAIMDKRAMGGVQTADWYFYNPKTVSKGKLEFQRKFGNRRLEDNWNRKNKAFIAIDDNTDNTSTELEEGNEATDNDSTPKLQNSVVDNKNPQYYLNQIPKGEEQIATANKQIADALFEMANIYNDKLNDNKKAEETYNEFVHRFPYDPRGADALFVCYRNQEKEGNEAGKDKYKSELLAKFPDSKYAKILSQPNFRAQLERMMAMEDSIYEQTYKDYLNSEYNKVMSTANRMEKEFPVSPLIPKFMLLKSLSAGKLGDKDSLTNSLNTLLARYPNSDVATMAKDVLALMAQGNTPQAGNNSNLANIREKVLNDSIATGEPKLKGFRYNEKTPYLYYLITDPAEVKENWLLYYTASYNFTKFLVKDFDLRVKNGTLVVSGLDNLEEALWYAKGIDEDNDMNKLLQGKKHRSLVISAENSELIGRGFTIEQYEQFYQDSIVHRKKQKASTKIELIGEEKAIDSLKNAASKIAVKTGDDLMKTNSTIKQNEPKENEVKKEEPKKEDNQQPQAEKKVENKAEEKTQEPIVPQKTAPKEKKELKKYKGLYTYDVDADHKFVIIVTKEGADVTNLIEAINKFNSEKQPLLNLKVSKTSGKGISQMLEIGILPGAKTAKSYLLQLAKDDGLRDALDKVPHRRIVISEDNLEALKSSGNINVYMELFRRLYLGR